MNPQGFDRPDGLVTLEKIDRTEKVFAVKGIPVRYTMKDMGSFFEVSRADDDQDPFMLRCYECDRENPADRHAVRCMVEDHIIGRLGHIVQKGITIKGEPPLPKGGDVDALDAVDAWTRKVLGEEDMITASYDGPVDAWVQKALDDAKVAESKPKVTGNEALGILNVRLRSAAKRWYGTYRKIATGQVKAEEYWPKDDAYSGGTDNCVMKMDGKPETLDEFVDRKATSIIGDLMYDYNGGIGLLAMREIGDPEDFEEHIEAVLRSQIQAMIERDSAPTTTAVESIPLA